MLVTSATLLAGVQAPASALARSFDGKYAGQTQSIASLDRTILERFMTERSAGRYFEDGVWHNPTLQSQCWWCFDGAGTAAAVLSRRPEYQSEASTLRAVAESTFNATISTEQRGDGAFQSEGSSGEIPTGFELIELGIAYLELRDVLAPSTRAHWARAVEKAADYLIGSGAMTWYINGNIQLHQVEDMWLAWQITGAARFHAAYEEEWQFTIHPPQTRWEGLGLHITVPPARSDWGDGAGYLTESGPGPPGFDPEYTTLQLDFATSLWVLTDDRRYLQLANLLLNQLRPLVSSRAILDARGGTRKNAMLPFFSMGSVVLMDSDARAGLDSFVAVQLPLVAYTFNTPVVYSNLNFYRGLSIWLSVPLLFQQWPNGYPASASAAAAGPRQARLSRRSTQPRWNTVPRAARRVSRSS